MKTIQRRDGRILIKVHPDDNVLVAKVEVMALDSERAGEFVERGEATRGEGDW